MHQPTAQTRGLVEAMVVNGVPQTDIAKAMRLDPKTLRKCYRDVLDNATVVLCAKVARNLGAIACRGKGAAAVSACRYILGCKANWKDTSRLEVEPSPAALDYLEGSRSAREIIKEKLDQLAARHEISAYEPL